MSNNPPLKPPTSNPPLISLEPLNSMERPADLEGPNPLQVLALEPQPDDGSRRRPCLFLILHLLFLSPLLISVAPGRLQVPGPVPRRHRGQPRQGGVGQHGRAVDVGAHEVVRCDHRGARQRRAGLWVCHVVCAMPVLGGGGEAYGDYGGPVLCAVAPLPVVPLRLGGVESPLYQGRNEICVLSRPPAGQSDGSNMCEKRY